MTRQRGGKSSGGGAGSRSSERVRTARGRKISSTRWLQRQLNDPYVSEAKRQGYRSRAAFKLMEIDDRFHLLRSGCRVLDLGAAPGGWSQIAVERAGADTVVAVDVAEMDPVLGAEVLVLDVYDEDAPDRIRAALGTAADVVLSDMAPSAIGHAATDHLRIMALADAAYAVAELVLAPDGAFVAKVLQGGTEGALLDMLKRRFATVKHVKPPASRKDSSELYVVATGFRPAESASS